MMKAATTQRSSLQGATRKRSGRELITEIPGNIFQAPENSVLIHACNCVGAWGGGVAGQFAQRFKGADKFYRKHCKKLAPATTLGSCLIIPPQPEDVQQQGRYWIACLLTKEKPGAPKNQRETFDLVEATRYSCYEFRRQYMKLKRDGEQIGSIFSVMINAGIFTVPWPVSRKYLKRTGFAITVLYPEGSEEILCPAPSVTEQFEAKIEAERSLVRAETERAKQQYRAEKAAGKAVGNPSLGKTSASVGQTGHDAKAAMMKGLLAGAVGPAKVSSWMAAKRGNDISASGFHRTVQASKDNETVPAKILETSRLEVRPEASRVQRGNLKHQARRNVQEALTILDTISGGKKRKSSDASQTEQTRSLKREKAVESGKRTKRQ